MKELYEELELEVISFKTEDIITTSDATTSDQTPADPTTGGGTNGGSNETDGGDTTTDNHYFDTNGNPVPAPSKLDVEGGELTVGGVTYEEGYMDENSNMWGRIGDDYYLLPTS